MHTVCAALEIGLSSRLCSRTKSWTRLNRIDLTVDLEGPQGQVIQLSNPGRYPMTIKGNGYCTGPELNLEGSMCLQVMDKRDGFLFAVREDRHWTLED